MPGIPAEGIRFLRDLRANNTKAWFDAHRKVYEEQLLEPAKELVLDVGERLRRIAPGVHAEPRVQGGSILRINRDTRFSKDKSPYKDHLDFFFWEAGSGASMSGAGFFLRITPEDATIGAGKHSFEPPLLEAYRRAVSAPDTGESLAMAIDQVRASGPYELGGRSYKQVPRGLDPDHPRAELLKHNGLYAWLETPHPKEVSTPAFGGWCCQHWENMAPVHHWLVRLMRSVA